MLEQEYKLSLCVFWEKWIKTVCRHARGRGDLNLESNRDFETLVRPSRR
jgi:hypothetical protein